MRGFAKVTFMSIVVTVALYVLTSFIYFFPWYTTLIVETFNVSQIVAGDNYLKQTYYEETLDRLKDKPIFREYPGKIELIVLNDDGRNAVGDNDEEIYEGSVEGDKPYKQRGNPLTVEMSAVYPLKATLWGETYTYDIPIDFSMKTVGLKHYKDLEYYFD